jgi:hypothetical protein
LNSHVAPEFMLDEVLKPASDPRIRVMFDKNISAGVENSDYFSMPSELTSTEQETNIGLGKYAILDASTFLLNTAFPGIIMTCAEVNFLKAEAFERWGSSAQAQTAYETAIKQSVDFYFYLNALGAASRGASAEDAVTSDELAALLNSPEVLYAGTTAEKLERIWTQKWLHFGFMQSIESWAEVRRTNYPQLTFVPDNSTPGSVVPPARLVYPTTEKTYNPANYATVEAEDTPETKIFWDVN